MCLSCHEQNFEKIVKTIQTVINPHHFESQPRNVRKEVVWISVPVHCGGRDQQRQNMSFAAIYDAEILHLLSDDGGRRLGDQNGGH